MFRSQAGREARLNIITASLGVLAALLTLAVAVLGVTTYRTSQQNSAVQSDANQLRTEKKNLQNEISSTQERVAALNQELNKANAALREARAHSSPTAPPLPTTVPILRPKGDPGYSRIWNGTFAVNSAGVRIGSAGVFPGGPQSWDLAYQPGGGESGWQENSNNGDNGAIYKWQGTGTPDPAWCHREYYDGSDVGLTSAQVGDRDCYADGNGIVGYLQVISVGPNGPTIRAWFWNGPPP